MSISNRKARKFNPSDLNVVSANVMETSDQVAYSWVTWQRAAVTRLYAFKIANGLAVQNSHWFHSAVLVCACDLQVAAQNWTRTHRVRWLLSLCLLYANGMEVLLTTGAWRDGDGS